jgi:WD40 repeat protein
MKTVRLVKIRTADLILLSAFILLFFSANVLAQTSSPEGNQPVLIPLKDIADVIKHLTVPGQGRIEELVFSPDARYLAMGSGNSILLWDLTSGEFKSLSVPVKFSTFYSECSFSPDGKTLASVISREKLVLWDLTTGSNGSWRQILPSSVWPTVRMASCWPPVPIQREFPSGMPVPAKG